ncbi:hypothetical protein [Dyella solisilvae]|nr:hypothetical protein [Dyella solisilvae]
MQEDVSFLFWLDYGRVRQMPVLIADRLLSFRLVHRVEPMHGAHVPDRGDLSIDVSALGHELMAAVRNGLDPRFRMPEP